MPAPIITVEQMRKWEAATWDAGITEEAVIRQVGEVVARRIRQLTEPGELILLLAGKGNNGEDVRQTLPYLESREARLVNVREPAAALPEVREWLAKQPALVVDGLFGIGLNRPLAEDWCAVIEAVNEAGVPVLSVDGPSGLDAASGEVQGAAIRADRTLTLGAPKAGLLGTRVDAYVGRLEVAEEIGLVSNPCASELFWSVADDFADYPDTRGLQSHKGTYGHLVIMAGSLGYHGASVLATRAAQRARPGLISLYTSPDVYVPVAAQLQAAMVHPWHSGTELPAKASALLVGPGLASAHVADELKTLVCRCWVESPLPMVVDASALDWLSEGEVLSNAPRIITPHPGEAARMLGNSTREVQADRVGTLRRLSQAFGQAIVVLKGHQTLVGYAEGPVFVNSSGGPSLAQGGSGDILAGYLAGLLAQPSLAEDAIQVCRFAVWEHGRAADQLDICDRSWTIDQLSEVLGRLESDERVC